MTLKAALIAALAVSWAGAARAQDPAPPSKPIFPGWWSYKASTVLDASSSGKQCVRPEKIDEFLSGPHNRHYKCTYPARTVADGRASFSGVCVGKHGETYRITVDGDYSDTHFTLKGHISGKFVVPLTLPISIDAHWLAAECPPGSK